MDTIALVVFGLFLLLWIRRSVVNFRSEMPSLSGLRSRADDQNQKK